MRRILLTVLRAQFPPSTYAIEISIPLVYSFLLLSNVGHLLQTLQHLATEEATAFLCWLATNSFKFLQNYVNILDHLGPPFGSLLPSSPASYQRQKRMRNEVLISAHKEGVLRQQNVQMILNVYLGLCAASFP